MDTDPLPEYLNLFVNVTFDDRSGDVTCRPHQLNIPGDSIATITWIPTASNFTFKHFQWCQTNGFLTQHPIHHELCIISAVHNTGEEGCRGIFRYQLTVTSNANKKEYSTPNCPGPGMRSNGQPKINNQ